MASTNANNRTNELTAEWTVHAQLTISRPNANTTTTIADNEFTQSTNNLTKSHNTNSSSSGNNPLKVIYKWSSQNDDKIPDEKSKVFDKFSISFLSNV